jgi:oxygen-dependent protoporphyrinogen oxidase
MYKKAGLMPRRVVVLGAGISGLSCAWYLKKRFGASVDVTVLENQDRVGGLIRSVRSDGFLFEWGPHSLRTKGSGLFTLRLVEELGLNNQVTVADPASHVRYLYTNGVLRSFPTGFFSFLSSPLTRGAVLPLLREYWIAKNPATDETIHSFISRRLNSEIAEGLVDPLISGIYAGDIRKLSVRSCFPLLHEWEQTRGSLCSGIVRARKKNGDSESPFVRSVQKSAIFSFKNGIETLVHALAERVEASIHLKARVQRLIFSPSGVSVHLSDKRILEADYVFSTLRSGELAAMTGMNLGLPKMASYPRATVAVVNLGYRKGVLDKRGFGYLVPSKEREEILGCLWDSSVFPEQNFYLGETRLTVMMGGVHNPSVASLSERECLSRALSSIEKHLGVSAQPDQSTVYMARDAIPQFELGFHESREMFLQEVKELSPRLIVSGNEFTGVSVNDCIAGNHNNVAGCQIFI